MSCNDVCMTVEDDGTTAFCNQVERRARKGYRCEECRTAIAVGEKYEYLSGKFDGDFMTARTCLVCVEIRGAFYCGGFMIGTLWDDVREQMFPLWNEVTAIDCLARLTTQPAIDKMRAEYAKWGAR